MDALVFEIVDRVDRLHLVELAVGTIVGFHQGRDHASLPVVQVQDIRLEIHRFTDDLEYGTLEKAEALDVKGILNVELAVAEIILIVDEINRHLIEIHAVNATIQRPPAHADHFPAQEVELVSVFVLDLLVHGQDTANVDANLAQALWQGTGKALLSPLNRDRN